MSENTNAQISIIMAAYNAERTIRQAIDSVLAQTYINFELLVVDDCSVDSTKAIVETYERQDSRVRLLCNSVNIGVSRSRLKALNAAKGDWIAILDSDDAWVMDKLQKQMDMQKRTNASLLYSGSAFMNHDGKSIDWIMHVPETVTYRMLLKQNILSNSSSLCRKDLYEKYYVVGDQIHEDFALWLGILKSGETAYGIDEPLLIYRISTGSKSGNKLTAARMNWNTYRKVGVSTMAAVYYELCYIIKNIIKYLAIAMH